MTNRGSFIDGRTRRRFSIDAGIGIVGDRTAGLTSET